MKEHISANVMLSRIRTAFTTSRILARSLNTVLFVDYSRVHDLLHVSGEILKTRSSQH